MINQTNPTSIFMALAMFLCVFLHAQKKNADFKIHLFHTGETFTIDGIGKEEAWQKAEPANDFFMVLPMDDRKATQPSEVKMAYDDKQLYLLATFFKTPGNTYVVESLRRDFSFNGNDNFLLFMDPFNNQTTGFSFGANAYGAQWDGTMSNGGSIDLNWDSKWVSQIQNHKDKWVVEMAIPFKSIRYEKDVTQWGVNFSRLDLSTNEKSSWTPIPRQFPTASLAYTGTMVWDSPPPKQGLNYSIIPYVLGTVGSSSIDNITYDNEFKVGGDVKLGLTSSLNLDLTINPDFSQVEADRQVANLNRFELFFPERRQFFLENADLFASFGYDEIRPFFSRRIGLGVPIIAGARVSGNINRNLRLGMMDMQTDKMDQTGLPGQNFAVLSLQQKVFSRSNIGLMFVNKESLDYNSLADSLQTQHTKFNRNLGLEYNLASADNKYNGKVFMLQSFGPDPSYTGIAQGAHLAFNSRKWNWRVQQEYISDDFTSEVGFVPRKNYIKLEGSVGHLFLPASETVVSHGPQYTGFYYFDPNMNSTDYVSILGYAVNFMDRSSLGVDVFNEYVQLLAPFDPTNTNKEELATGTRHHWNGVYLSYNSRPKNLFTYNLTTRLGRYFSGGYRTNLNAELGYRFQPYVSLGAVLSYNNLDLPEPWYTTDFWLVGTEADITFTNKLFWNTLFQYNEQINNFGINSRLQWRYSPASDLFLVFNNNEQLSPLEGNLWSLTLKFTYWFNR
ncbi:MAG: carbohydrate binding family 9 domain-containing protein [Flavobacteriaceae bacterium]|nr:carbohydrate binding family 9 domain-containing protein [Flavobacteriaceae bacterium]